LEILTAVKTAQVKADLKVGPWDDMKESKMVV